MITKRISGPRSTEKGKEYAEGEEPLTVPVRTVEAKEGKEKGSEGEKEGEAEPLTGTDGWWMTSSWAVTEAQ